MLKRPPDSYSREVETINFIGPNSW